MYAAIVKILGLVHNFLQIYIFVDYSNRDELKPLSTLQCQHFH